MTQKFPYWAALAFATALLILAALSNGTCDEGDSIMHYIIARHAFEHPINFFDHWGKPVFTLLAAPFAYWGFMGMKLFNVLVSSFTVFFTVRIAQMLRFVRSYLVAVLLCFAPMYITNALSGLTEPLLALTLSIALYLCLRQQLLWATLLISFTPFMRSEGLIISGVFAAYLVHHWRWKYLPLLLFGHLVYSIAGYPYYHDWLWVFHKIPYSTLEPVYGSGSLLHFIKKLPEVVGRPANIFIALGVCYGIWRLAKDIWQNWRVSVTNQTDNWALALSIHHNEQSMSREEFWLIYGWSITFFVAHSLFWYLGIFASFGLMRVLIGIMPLLALVGVRGINFFLDSILSISPKVKNALAGIIALLVIGLNISSFHWQTNFGLNAAQHAFDKISQFVGNRYPQHTFYFDAIYGVMSLPKNFYDPMQYRPTTALYDGSPIPEKSLVIWDDWFSVVEAHNSLEKISQDRRFKLLQCFEEEVPIHKNRRKLCVFEKQPTPDSLQNQLLHHTFDAAPFDTSRSKIGKGSVKLDSNNAFSPGIDIYSAYLSPDCKALKVTAWVYQEQPIDTTVALPKLVHSYQQFQEVYGWNGQNIPHNLPLKQWHELSYTIPIQAEHRHKERLQIYFWNPNSTSIWIDDLVVTLQKNP